MSILQELLQISQMNEFVPGHPGQELPGINDKDKEEEPAEGEEEKPDQHAQNSRDTLTNLFKAHDDDNTLAVYVRNDSFQIRQAQPEEQIRVSWPGENTSMVHAEEGQYVVRNPDQTAKMKLIDANDLKEKYEMIDTNAKPDAEGFISYRLKGEVLAFQYVEKETLDINVSGHTIKIEPEDYIGHPSDNSKKLIIMSKTDFEAKYRLS